MRPVFLMLLCALCCCCFAGCEQAIATDWPAIVSSDLALASLSQEKTPPPAPWPLPLPDDSGAKLESIGGPLDTIRGASDLVTKGNALADEARVILDAAKRSGKISVDIKIPVNAEIKANLPATAADTQQAANKKQPTISSGCSNGKCGMIETRWRIRRR